MAALVTSVPQQSSQSAAASSAMPWSAPSPRARPPVAPYAFTSTPTLTTANAGSAGPRNRQQSSSPRLSLEMRETSEPQNSLQLPPIAGYAAAGSAASSSSSSASSPRSSSSNPGVRVDSTIPSRQSSRGDPMLRPLSTTQSSKPSPDRYRRPSRQQDPKQPAPRGGAAASPIERGPTELAKRYRRRSAGNLDAARQEFLATDASQMDVAADWKSFEIPRPRSSHSHRESAGSVESGCSSSSSVGPFGLL